MRREFRIVMHRHKRNGLFMATSPDHKGFNVVARTEEEVERIIPEAIRALLEAEGHTVESVTAEPEFEAIPEFVSPTFKAAAELKAA